jgi:hypothetical protein
LLGQKELIAATKGVDEVVFVGITCGVSAPYALGQVDWAMDQPGCHFVFTVLCPCCGSEVCVCLSPRFTTVLMGFNPARLARGAAVEGWHKCCRGTCESAHCYKGCPCVMDCSTDVALAMEARQDDTHILLNPALGTIRTLPSLSVLCRCFQLDELCGLGPEPITGSTRMKGGTATKVLLVRPFPTLGNKC